MAEASLLVPLKVEALVIEDQVIDDFVFKKVQQSGRTLAGDGKWSPRGSDYANTVANLDPVGPPPFFGAQPDESGSVLGFRSDTRLKPTSADRGVYLHWILPPGLRHGDKALNYPALPDQWLVVRFSRGAAATGSRAWFIDSGLPVDGAANRVVPHAEGNGRPRPTARRFGKVFPLEKGQPPVPAGPRTKTTAIGNAHTGSRWFTGFVADNRDCLSFFDDLGDHRTGGAGTVPADLVVSYLVVGWFAEQGDEPLRAVLGAGRSEAEIREALANLQWDPGAAVAGRCYFHGLLAHVNFWNPATYKGQFLGYPGAHAQHGTYRDQRPPLKVSVGFSAVDALAALIADGDDSSNGTALWQTLEAVAYHQQDAILAGADTTLLEQARQIATYRTVDAGCTWTIRAPESAAAGLSPGIAKDFGSAPTPQPSADQLARLGALNQTQREADAIARDLAGLQQEFHTRWWKLCRFAATESWNEWEAEEAACAALDARVAALKTAFAARAAALQGQIEPLRAALTSDRLELQSTPAPRFWAPADPVLLISNYGHRDRQAFPKLLPVRTGDRLVDRAEVVVDQSPQAAAAPVAVDAALVALLSVFVPAPVNGLLEEARQLEASFAALASRALPEGRSFRDENTWRAWTERLDAVFAPAASPAARDRLVFQAGPNAIAPWRLMTPWLRQPWSPLFLDWQVTWHPTDLDEAPEKAAKGHAFRGRSMMSPIDSEFFERPMETLKGLLKKGARAELVDILQRYLDSWKNTLDGLRAKGLLGQALEGFHQALAGRDVTLPRIQPNAAVPWNDDDESKFTDPKAAAVLQAVAARPDQVPLALPALAPPAQSKRPPFTLKRAGSFTLDHLWLIDDFGQWCDLLQGSTAGRSSGLALNPRLQCKVGGVERVAVPPRLLQPSRLQFRFTRAGQRDTECGEGLAESPVIGWVFHHLLDEALAVCDASGQLIGALHAQENAPAHWEDFVRRGGSDVATIPERGLREFVQGLVPAGALPAFLELVDWGLARSRPAQARNRERLAGRPLALVSARLGLELFGEPWRDPETGQPDSALAGLVRRVRLGRAENAEDGLIGCYADAAMGRIVPSWAAAPFAYDTSGYIAPATQREIEVGLAGPRQVVLLMDPSGAVSAETNLLPAKSIALPASILQAALTRLEVSFRVGPVLLPPGAPALPVPAGDEGRWRFDDGATSQSVVALAQAPDLSGNRPTVAEGRLVLDRDETPPP